MAVILAFTLIVTTSCNVFESTLINTITYHNCYHIHHAHHPFYYPHHDDHHPQDH